MNLIGFMFHKHNILFFIFLLGPFVTDNYTKVECVKKKDGAVWQDIGYL